jgi:hypothetical protein
MRCRGLLNFGTSKRAAREEIVTTILFIHGTGVRQPVFQESFALAHKGLAVALQKAGRAPVRIDPCLWGDSLGSRLNAQGVTIPDYRRTGTADKTDKVKDDQVLLWQMLGYDSLFELRGLALRPAKAAVDLPSFTRRLQALPSAELAPLLEQVGVAATFGPARDYVVQASDYERAVLAAADESDLFAPVARAVVAEAVERCPPDTPPALAWDPNLRDQVIEGLTRALGLPTRSVAGWTANRLFGLAQRLGVVDLRYRRGGITDALTPAAGDVLLYQSNGGAIRDFIRHRIEAAARLSPPVVLVAHSLGGIACVDLLAGSAPPPVAALVTAGSQAPYLYEINALHSLRYGQPLPAGFPRWLNIYDRRDLLGYLAGRVFALQGSVPEITDRAVDNGLPFPDAHSGYWANPAVWDAIVAVLP